MARTQAIYKSRYQVIKVMDSITQETRDIKLEVNVIGESGPGVLSDVIEVKHVKDGDEDYDFDLKLATMLAKRMKLPVSRMEFDEENSTMTFRTELFSLQEGM